MFASFSQSMTSLRRGSARLSVRQRTAALLVGVTIFAVGARVGAAGQAEGLESIAIQKALIARDVQVDKRLRSALDRAGELWRREIGGVPALAPFFRWAIEAKEGLGVSLTPVRPAIMEAAGRSGWLNEANDPTAALAFSISDRGLRLIPQEESAIRALSLAFERRSDLLRLFSKDGFVDARALLRWAAGPDTPTGADPSYRALHRYQSAYQRLSR